MEFQRIKVLLVEERQQRQIGDMSDCSEVKPRGQASVTFSQQLKILHEKFPRTQEISIFLCLLPQLLRGTSGSRKTSIRGPTSRREEELLSSASGSREPSVRGPTSRREVELRTLEL